MRLDWTEPHVWRPWVDEIAQAQLSIETAALVRDSANVFWQPGLGLYGAIIVGAHGLVEEEPLSLREAVDEALVMGLRLSEGIDVVALEERFAIPAVDWSAVERHSNAGLLERNEGRIRTTPQGRLVLDSLLAAIAA